METTASKKSIEKEPVWWDAESAMEAPEPPPRSPQVDTAAAALFAQLYD